MAREIDFGLDPAAARPHYPRHLRLALLLSLAVVLSSALTAGFIAPGFVLATYSDMLQVALLVLAAWLAFRNSLCTHGRVRAFWMLIFAGTALWSASTTIWTFYELALGKPVPDLPFVDILLFVKIVPLTLAVAIGPDREHDSRFRAFGLLDFSILITYALYLYAFCVFAYRLLPGALDAYNFRFNLANAAGNLVFMAVAAIAVMRSGGYWKGLYRIYFFSAACYNLGSDLSNVAIDQGTYHTGSLYDLPLVTALVAFVCVPLIGQSVPENPPHEEAAKDSEETHRRPALASSHLAMIVALSTPLIGIWLLSSPSAPPQLRSFRLGITLLTILVLTLLISIKQDLLTAGLVGSLERLSETYVSINRFKTHLTQSEKLASLGELVADVAIQIKSCMSSILKTSARLTSRPDAESRIQSMAGKIGQYAQRTDLLVDNMLHFAQETPLRLAPLDIKSLIESALHLSRVAKLRNVHVDLFEEVTCRPVYGDSSQLLHVFLQLISNAMDALEETGGGSFVITIRPNGSRVVVEFADSGPGLKEPQRVFEPFYTTKPVGKGTGLGLSTCYGIIQQHDGEIYCCNRQEGGAAFSVVLPLTAEANPGNGRASELLAEGML
jgi:signal transduction histidine kinase